MWRLMSLTLAAILGLGVVVNQVAIQVEDDMVGGLLALAPGLLTNLLMIYGVWAVLLVVTSWRVFLGI